MLVRFARAASFSSVSVSLTRRSGGSFSLSKRCFSDKNEIEENNVITHDPKESLFAKFVDGDIPLQRLYEDELALAFKDINPAAPVHVLVIPKEPIGGISAVEEDHALVLGHLMVVANRVAQQMDIHPKLHPDGSDRDQREALGKGFRVVVNDGAHGQQSIRWLHLHVIGGKQLTWPPG